MPVAEIEYAERLIMEGLNYEFRCHHVGSTIDILFSDSLLSCTPDKSRARGDLSPRASVEYRDEKAFLWRKALDIAQRALIFSDAHFLFNPCHTAFAVTAIAIGSVTVEGNMSGKLQKYVAKLFPTKTKAELDDFSQSVGDIIHMLVNCPSLDLRPGCGHASEIIIERAEELRRVLGEVATIRLLRKMKRFQSWPCKSRKRSRFELDFTPPRQLQTRKYAKITPI